MTVTSQDIPGTLDKHKKWTLSQEGGQRADLQGANLRGANLQGAYLQGAYLQDAYLQGANLRGANLQGAYLQDAYLQGAYLRGAYLQGAYLQDAYLQGANLQGANLQGGKVAEGSKIVAIGPVGNRDRQVFGVIAQEDDVHKKPWLLFICGCFSGDEKQYKQRVNKIYEKGSAHHKQCFVALNAIKSISKTWGVK